MLGLISLGGGLPSSEYFPFEHIEIKVPTIPHFSEDETQKCGTLQRIGKHDIAEGKSLYGKKDKAGEDWLAYLLTGFKTYMWPLTTDSRPARHRCLDSSLNIQR